MTTITAPTDKQMAFRSTLISDLLDNNARAMFSLNARYAAPKLVDCAIALSLPTPTTVAEASAQIDALRSGIQTWTRANQDAAQAVFDKLIAAWGDNPATWAKPSSQTEIRALLAEVL